jgi:phosphoglycolate phosphatase-like HAD superfamily hydrolase
MDLAPVIGIPEILASLPENTHIISSSSEKIIQEYLKRHNLSEYIHSDAIWGHETARKKTDKFIMLADKLPDHAILFITDTTGDIIEAREVVRTHGLDISTVGVSWGWMYRDWLEEMMPEYLVDEVAELELIVQNFLKK